MLLSARMPAGMLGPDGFQARRLSGGTFPELDDLLYTAAQPACIQLIALHPFEVITTIRYCR